ncbi:MAG: FHA domain-containing protein [Ilumatobacteraceae bacterium]
MSDANEATTSAWLVLYQPGQAPVTVPLDGELTIGRHVGQDDVVGHLATHGDPAVSRLHVVLLPKPTGWCLQATSTTNGVFVNGERLAPGAVQLLRPNDQVHLGERTRLVFHTIGAGATDRSQTQTARRRPDLTPGERRVLLSLCSPVMNGDAFTPPASVPAIAEALSVTQSAVKQQLGRLYLKFDVPEGTDRRVRLANEALTCGAVRLADLQSFQDDA